MEYSMYVAFLYNLIFVLFFDVRYAFKANLMSFTIIKQTMSHLLSLRTILLYHPQTVFVGGYTVFTLSDRPCVRNVLFQ